MTDPTHTIADLRQAMLKASWEKAAEDADTISSILADGIVASALAEKTPPVTVLHIAGGMFCKLLVHCSKPGTSVGMLDQLWPSIREYVREADAGRAQDGPPRPDVGPGSGLG